MKNTPLFAADFTDKDKARFWKKVDVRGDAECWPWKTGRFSCGYGNFGIFGRPHRASRIAFVLANGTITGGMCVLHSCDERSCCNPKHLFAGTHLENMQDMKSKGRGAIREKHGMSKLNEKSILEIRSMYRKEDSTLASVADKFGVSLSTVSRIVNHKLWR